MTVTVEVVTHEKELTGAVMAFFPLRITSAPFNRKPVESGITSSRLCSGLTQEIRSSAAWLRRSMSNRRGSAASGLIESQMQGVAHARADLQQYGLRERDRRYR